MRIPFVNRSGLHHAFCECMTFWRNPSHENSLRESLGAASCILRMHDIYRLRAAKRARETTDATIKLITASMSPCIPTNAMTNKNGLLTPIVLTMP